MKVFGQGAVNIAGHKVSYGLLAAVAGIAGAVLIFIQMRNAGSSIGAGSTPATGYTDAQGNVYDANGNLISAAAPASGSASGADWQSAFSALSSQISALNFGTSSAPSMSAPSSPAAVAASAGYANYATQWGNTGAQTGPANAQPGEPQPTVSQPKPSYAQQGTGGGPPIAAGYSGYAAPIRATYQVTSPSYQLVQGRKRVTIPAQATSVQEVNPPGSTAQMNEAATGYVLTSAYGAGL